MASRAIIKPFRLGSRFVSLFAKVTSLKLSEIDLPLRYAVWFPEIILFRLSVSCLLSALVMSLWSQFDKVIGLQFFRSFEFLPIFGISLSHEILWDSGSFLVWRECCQAFSRTGPYHCLVALR